MNRKWMRASRWLVAAVFVAATITGTLLWNATRAAAYSSYLTAAEGKYTSIVGSTLDNCNLCHGAGGTKTYNPYGTAYGAAGHSFTAIEALDSDGDGYTNLAEITALTMPGDPNSHPGATPTATPTKPAVPPTATSTGVAPTATAAPTSGAPTATPVPLTNRAAFIGSVNSLPQASNRTGDWSVGSRTVHVGTTTRIENSQLLSTGSQVWVLGSRRTDGSVSGAYVRVLSAGTSGGGGDRVDH